MSPENAMASVPLSMVSTVCAPAGAASDRAARVAAASAAIFDLRISMCVLLFGVDALAGHGLNVGRHTDLGMAAIRDGIERLRHAGYSPTGASSPLHRSTSHARGNDERRAIGDDRAASWSRREGATQAIAATRRAALPAASV